MATDPSVLARLAVFAAVGEPSRARIASVADVVRAPAGTELFREGAPAEDVYFVLEGRVSLSVGLPGRTEMTVLSLGPGEITGWSGILARERMATARAVTDAELLRVPGAALEDACEQDHELGYRVMKQLASELAHRLRDTRRQLLDVFGAAE